MKKLTQPIAQHLVDICEQIEKRMCYLYQRWLDESQYEDFNDYAKEMEKEAGKIEEVTFIKACKRPFGFQFTTSQHPGHVFQYCMSNKKDKIKVDIKYWEE